MTGKATYLTRCVDLSQAQVPALEAMVDRGRTISFATFARHTHWQALARLLGYSVGHTPGLHLREDHHVSFHRSRWQGRPCYYLVWSAIEHVFV